MLENLTWLGHDAFRVSAGGVTVYIDPYELPAGAPFADVVLVTHAHYDHFDKGDLARVTTPATVTVGPADVTAQLGGQTRTIAAGESLEVKGIGVRAIPAYNTDKFRAPGEVFHPRESGWLGYVFSVGGTSYYHAGDSDEVPEMADVDVDVALLPVSGTYVMTPEEAAAVCGKLRARVVVPMHWGSIVGSAGEAERFKALCPLPVEILRPGTRGKR